MAVAPAVDDVLTIYSSVPLTQERAWNNMDVIDTDEIEKADDKLTRICLQLKEELGRCVKFTVADPEPDEEFKPAELLAARDVALAARDGALASEAVAGTKALEAGESAALAVGSAALASSYAGQAEAGRDEASLSEQQAADHERQAGLYAAQAFGATAPAFDAGANYNFPDGVACTDGHTYRAVGPVSGEAPPTSLNWVRITVSFGDFFEQDDDGDIIPSSDPLYSEQFTLDPDGDIIPAG